MVKQTEGKKVTANESTSSDPGKHMRQVSEGVAGFLLNRYLMQRDMDRKLQENSTNS